MRSRGRARGISRTSEPFFLVLFFSKSLGVVSFCLEELLEVWLTKVFSFKCSICSSTKCPVAMLASKTTFVEDQAIRLQLLHWVNGFATNMTFA